MNNEATITLSTEQDENLVACVSNFLESHPQWNQDQVISAGISLFLLQNSQDMGFGDRQICSEKYINLLCMENSKYAHN